MKMGIYWSLKPLLLLNRLLGLGLFPIKKTGRINEEKFVILYSVSVQLIVGLCLILWAHKAITHEYLRSLEPIDLLAHTIFRFVLLSLPLAIGWFCLLRCSQIDRLIKDILILDEAMVQLKSRPRISFLRRAVNKDLIFLAFWAMLYPFIIAFKMNFGLSGVDLLNFLVFYTSLSMSSVLLLVRNLMRCVGVRISRLNAEMRRYLEAMDSDWHEESNRVLLDVKSSDASLADWVQAWMSFHLSLHRISKQLVRIFGAVILFGVNYLLLAVILTSFFTWRIISLGARFPMERDWVLGGLYILSPKLSLVLLVLFTSQCTWKEVNIFY